MQQWLVVLCFIPVFYGSAYIQAYATRPIKWCKQVYCCMYAAFTCQAWLSLNCCFTQHVTTLLISISKQNVKFLLKMCCPLFWWCGNHTQSLYTGQPITVIMISYNRDCNFVFFSEIYSYKQQFGNYWTF